MMVQTQPDPIVQIDSDNQFIVFFSLTPTLCFLSPFILIDFAITIYNTSYLTYAFITIILEVTYILRLKPYITYALN